MMSTFWVKDSKKNSVRIKIIKEVSIEEVGLDLDPKR